MIPVVLFTAAVTAASVQEPPAPGAVERILVEAVPESESGLRPGDFVIAAEGRPVTSLAAFRSGVGESFGKTFRVRVMRDGKEADLEWVPGTGTYAFSGWPSEAEVFRRAHADRENEDGVRAGIRALEAVRLGRARTATRYLDKAKAEGVDDPLLDWARGWVLLRLRNDVEGYRAAVDAALKQVKDARGAYGRRIRGLCRLALGYHEMAVGNTHGAVTSCRAAWADGADAGDLARRLAGMLREGGRGTKESRKLALELMVEAFEKDPLHAEQAELLARIAGTEQECRRYAAAARRLSGNKPLDPAIELAPLVSALDSGEAAAGALVEFLEHVEGLDGRARASACDALGGFHETKSRPREGLRWRARAFSAAPTIERGKHLLRLAKDTEDYPPALRVLRAIYEKGGTPDTLRLYMGIYVSLYDDAMKKHAPDLVLEAVRLKRMGRAREAAAFLAERTEALALPGLKVAAGQILEECGEKAGLDSWFEDEYHFWYRSAYLETGWSDNYRFTQLYGRTGYPRGLSAGYVDNLKWVKGAYRAGYYATMAAVHARAGNREETVDHLREAARAIKPDAPGKLRIPFYAEGRLCRTARDYIEVLEERLKTGIKMPEQPEDGNR